MSYAPPGPNLVFDTPGLTHYCILFSNTVQPYRRKSKEKVYILLLQSISVTASQATSRRQTLKKHRLNADTRGRWSGAGHHILTEVKTLINDKRNILYAEVQFRLG